MNSSSCSILFGGDICPQERVESLLLEKKYSDVFSDLKAVASGYDFSIVNLECPIVEKGDICEPIEKCGRNLKCSGEIINALEDAGIKGVTLANNHVRDYGDSAILKTITQLDKRGIAHVGAGQTLNDARRILYKEVNGRSVAFVNFCENEFSIATDDRAGAAPMDAVNNYEDITQARKNADIVIVIVHGGHEFYQLPSPRMKKLYHWYIDLGADAVINHHQHCFSGYEYYKEKPIFYGLGNLCFDKALKRNDNWNQGFLVALSFGESISHHIIPYEQCNEIPKITILNEGNDKAVLDSIALLNKVIVDDTELKRKHDLFCKNRFGELNMYLSPYQNKYLRLLCNKGLLPSFVTNNKKKFISNYVFCESQRDLFEKYLTAE